MTEWPIHARISGPIVMIGFGSIGKGTLPLIERHIAFDRTKFVVIAPDDDDRKLVDDRQIRIEPDRDAALALVQSHRVGRGRREQRGDLAERDVTLVMAVGQHHRQ